MLVPPSAWMARMRLMICEAPATGTGLMTMSAAPEKPTRPTSESGRRITDWTAATPALRAALIGPPPIELE